MKQCGSWEEAGGDLQGRRREGLTMGKDVSREEKKGLRAGATGGEIEGRKEQWHERAEDAKLGKK